MWCVNMARVAIVAGCMSCLRSPKGRNDQEGANMVNKFRIAKGVKHGLEIWSLFKDGQPCGTFFSERAALNKLALEHQKDRWQERERSRPA